MLGEKLLHDSNIDRLLKTFKHEKTDRVPNFEIQIGARSVAHILNQNGYKQTFWAMPPEDAVALVTAIGQDAIVCSICPPMPPHGSIQTPDDLAAYLNADIDIATMRAKLQTYLNAVVGTDIGVVLRLGGPMTQTYMSCGPVPVQSFMLMLYDQPELIDACMDLYTGWMLKIIDACKNMPFHLYYIGDDLCDNKGPMISLELINRIWAPHYQHIIAAAHATKRPVICHCCGNQTSVIPYWLKWGVEAWHPLQSGANDIYSIKKNYGDRVTLIGNISVGVLSSGTQDEVREDVRRHIDVLARDGGYVVCSDHSIIDSVIPENFQTMIAATQTYGSNIFKDDI